MEAEKNAYLFIKYIHANQSLSGTKYLIYIIKNVLVNSEKIDNITSARNGLYRETAEQFSAKSSMAVERAIRHLTETLYTTMPADRYESVFGTARKVTNKQFIETACNFIRYESDKLASDK